MDGISILHHGCQEVLVAELLEAPLAVQFQILTAHDVLFNRMRHKSKHSPINNNKSNKVLIYFNKTIAYD